MTSDITHVYLMPGMAANPSIFEHIKLPEDRYKIHWLEWQIPEKDENKLQQMEEIDQDSKA